MGAASAVAPIPIIGPAMAEAAAASMDKLGAAQMVLASAEGGWGEVPFDGAPAVLHKQEMVLPAKFAIPLREMLEAPRYGLPDSVSPAAAAAASSPGRAAQAPAGNTQSPVTIHYSPSVQAIDTRNARRFFDDHGRYLVDVLARHHRNFARVQS